MMSKVAIVYWSGTGNTETMANLIAEGVRSNGSDAVVYQSADFTTKNVNEYNHIAFGCPSMGAEVLEEVEFQPMFDEVKGMLAGKKIALFGSYGWGDGEWMRNWASEIDSLGAQLIGEQVIISGAPDQECELKCKELGVQLTQA